MLFQNIAFGDMPLGIIKLDIVCHSKNTCDLIYATQEHFEFLADLAPFRRVFADLTTAGAYLHT